MSAFVILIGGAGLAMYLPAAHGYVLSDVATATTFFLHGTLCLFAAGLLALATMSGKHALGPRGQLLVLIGAFAALPLPLALPVNDIMDDTGFFDAWFEMVSAFTTTGATVFEQSDSVPRPVHLWRGLVAWLGGFFVWLTAVAILAPMNLGGFEVTSFREVGEGSGRISEVADAGRRLARFARPLFPVYLLLTSALWLGLLAAGEDPFGAAMLAMATLSTSGIVPAGFGDNPSVAVEMLVFVFLVFALSRRAFSADVLRLRRAELWGDEELRLGLLLVVAVPAALFLRHFVGAIEVDDTTDPAPALAALWGGMFTVAAFLTTAGFESGFWDAAQNWSGLRTPGMILMGLAVFGGGVATTAGGVKLMRVVALYRHGLREMEKLVHPNSVGGAGADARLIRRRGAGIAWIFFMLFALSIALVMAALALSDLTFDAALVLSLAALTTTGPMATAAADPAISYAALPDGAKAVLMAAMVLGRMETLALIALLNPEFWRS